MRPETADLIEICHKVYNKGFVAAFDGNLSLRTSSGTILITRSGVCKDEVKHKDIIETDHEGKILSGSGKISSENKIHYFIYSNRDDVNAVIHCHPVYTTAFSASSESFPSDIFPEVILTLGKVPVCKYATPSTEEVPRNLSPFISEGWAYILQNHGAVTLGRDIKDAYFKMEKLEHTAKILTAAEILGGAKPIAPGKIDELLEISEKVYGIKIKKDFKN